MRPVQRRDQGTRPHSHRIDRTLLPNRLYGPPCTSVSSRRARWALAGLGRDTRALPGRRGPPSRTWTTRPARGREVAPITKGKVRQNGHSARRARASPGEGPSARGPTSDNAGYRKLSDAEDEWTGRVPRCFHHPRICSRNRFAVISATHGNCANTHTSHQSTTAAATTLKRRTLQAHPGRGSSRCEPPSR